MDGSQIRVREDREHADTRGSRLVRNAAAVNGRGNAPEYAAPGTKVLHLANPLDAVRPHTQSSARCATCVLREQNKASALQ